ncbi:MAG: VOC family protein [Pseudomonadota bacterium]
MTSPFVWFDNIGAERAATTDFLSRAFGWTPQDIGPMTFLTNENAEMPFSATCDPISGISGWVPYIEVDDLADAVQSARSFGATVIAENIAGPAGDATFIKDPGGTPLALWKRAASA